MTPNLSVPLGYLGDRVQLAFVVRDMDAAINYWTKTLKVGPFVVMEKSRGNRTVHFRGVETLTDFSIAFAYMGDVQVELIQPLDDLPSIYKAFLDDGREGFHHLAYWPEDFRGACARLEANGFRELASIQTPDGGAAWSITRHQRI
jgi:catechol 2,3-dioxygenase-like lactoylglutathione lyase family enzyme